MGFFWFMMGFMMVDMVISVIYPISWDINHGHVEKKRYINAKKIVDDHPPGKFNTQGGKNRGDPEKELAALCFPQLFHPVLGSHVMNIHHWFIICHHMLH